MANKKNKKKVGRHSVLTPELVNKLEQAFSMDCSIMEACLLADISKQTFFNLKKQKPELFDRFEILRQRPILLARQTVLKHLSSDPKLAMQYLQAKCSDEFAIKNRTELTGKNGEPIVLKFDKADEKL